MLKVGHTLEGTNFADTNAAQAYAEQQHGPDGALLLDPYFIPWIGELCGGKTVMDIGCGAAPWSIAAAKAGAKEVIAFDVSIQMLGTGTYGGQCIR